MRSSTPTPAPRWCSATAPRSASLPIETGTSTPRAARTMLPNETSCQSRLGASRTSPSLRRTMPGTLIPMPTRGEEAGASATTSRTRPATIDPTCHASLPAAIVSARSRTVPPRPTRATTTRSTPRSTATTNGPSGAIRTPAEGRPAPREVPTAAAWTTAPSVSSSATRPAMVLRLSPMPLVSSARELVPRWCTWRSRVPRLWRRTASWLVPVPARRLVLIELRGP